MNVLNVGADIGHISLQKRSFARLDWNANLKASVAGSGRNTDLTADILDDAVDDIETEACAFANPFGSEEGIKDAPERFRRNARTVVGNFDENVVVFAGGVDSELAAFFHSVGGVVDDIGPDLIEFAAAGHDLGQIRSVVANHGDTALKLVIHDGESGFEAALDIDFLHGALIHVGVFLDSFNEIGNSRRAVFELISDAFHFEESGEAGEFRTDRCPSRCSEGCEVRIGQSGIRERGRELPGVLYIVCFEPCLNGFLALDAGKFVLELCGFQRGANFLFAFRQEAAVFGTNVRIASCLAQTNQAIAQSGSRTTRGSGRIVQFVSEAGGEFTERGELLVLLLSAGDVANAVREQTDETDRKLRHSPVKFRELADRKTEVMRGDNGAASYRDHFQPRERKHTGNIAGSDGKYGAVGASMLGPGAHLAFEHHQHVHGRVALAHDDFAGRRAAFFGYGNKPEEFLLRQVRKDTYTAQLCDEFFGRRWRGIFGHASPALLIGRLIVPW